MEFHTLKEVYDHSITTYGNRPAFAMLEREAMTYNDFNDRVDYVRGMLLGAGVGYGDKVALLSSNMPNWNVCYFAAVTAGIVVVPILTDFSGAELDRIILHSEAKALMVSDRLYARVSRHVIEAMNIVIRTKNLGVIARSSSELATARTPQPEDLAAIIYTSGTTSLPKGVMLTHRALATQVQMDRDLFFVKPEDIFLSILPLPHTYECSLGMLLPFMCGASVVYTDRPPTASNLLHALRQVRPTVILSVPLIIEKIYKTQVAAKFKHSKIWGMLYARPILRKAIHRIAGYRLYTLFGGRLRFFGIGGAKLEPETERFLYEGGFPYAIGYGMTETAPLIAGAIPSNVRQGSTGPILPGIEYRIESPNDEGEGELVVKSPCVMTGYYKNPEKTAEVLSDDGWLHTHDLCSVDRDGFLYVKGRLGNMILGSNDENIYPEDIESVLNSHSLVADSLVLEENGRLVALVYFNREEIAKQYHEFREDLATTMKDIKADIMRYVNSKVNRSSKIAAIEEQEQEFEKTPTHKIKRFLYTARHGSKHRQETE